MRVLRVVLAGLASAVAGLGFQPVFGGMSTALLLAIGTVTAVAMAVALSAVLLPRVPPVGVVLIGSVAVVVAIAAVIRPGADVLSGPWRLLTGALPADPSGPGLAAVAAVTAWSALAAGLLAARAAGPLVALLPPLGCLGVALAMGASGRPLPAWHALVVVALAAAIIATGRHERPRPGHLLAAATVAAVAVAGTAALAPSAPGVGLRPPADARALVDAPVLPRTGVSPLQQFPALRTGTTPLRLSGTVSTPVDRLRMVALHHFDGTFWTIRADYHRAGNRMPAPPPTTASGVETRQDVRLDLPGPLSWLPSAGRLTTVSVPDLGVDEASGDVTVPADRPVPTEYSATSVWLDVTADEIRAGEPTRRGPDVTPPPEIRTVADDATAGQPSGSGSLLALLNAFVGTNSDFRFDLSDEAPGGHGYYQITKLLKDKRGTPEQYASAFAVMARYRGYDSRVVLGFRPRYTGSTFTVTEKDVDAWAEVHYAGLGWVAFDPTPRDKPVGNTTNGQPPPPPPQRSDPGREAINPPVEPAPPAPEPLPEPGRDDDPALLIIMLGAGTVLLIAAAIPITKLVTRSRRRRLPPRESVYAAWIDTLDRLLETGLPASRALTTTQVVSLAATVPATISARPPLATLAAMTDYACFAPEEPDQTMPARAWTVSTEIRRHIRHNMSPLRRIRAMFDLRPLIRRENHGSRNV